MVVTRRTGLAAVAVAVTVAFVLIARIGASPIREHASHPAGPSFTQPLFGLDAPEHGPFPSDWYTVPDEANITGRHVWLPLPDAERITDVQDVNVLNELDGFNVRPRLSIPFTGPIDPASVTSDTVFLVSLGSTLPAEDYMPRGTKVGIDQVVFDALTNTLYVQSDALLAQHTRFALVVTHGVRDAGGARIKPSEAFETFRATVREDYKRALLEALQAARGAGVEAEDVAVASVFTTQSVTAILEKIRDQIHATTTAPADFKLGPNGERTAFNMTAQTSILWTQAPGATPVALNLSLVRNTFPGAVGVVAFGRYSSPDYLEHPGQYMEPVGTRTGTPVARGTSDIYFNLFLPSGAQPSGGWPVAIYGHGIQNDKNARPLNFVATMAHYGIATIAINAVGHGLSPLGTLTVNPAAENITFSAGGRAIDLNGDGKFGPAEGINASGDHQIVFASDAFRQTAADLMQLVRVIEAGIDANGDGTPDLDPARIYYYGQSYGSAYGTMFVAVEPDVRVGVLTVPTDPIPIGPLGIYRSLSAAPMLAARQPSLINFPGITDLGGLLFTTPTFDENMPLRAQEPLVVGFADLTTRKIQSPVTNTIEGAMAIQQWADRYEWVDEVGSPAAYAPHLRRAPLAGVAAKSVLFMIAKADQTAPNPTATAILRAGELADCALWYRHDLYWASCGNPLATVQNPHSFPGGLDNAFFRPIALASQQTAGSFLSSDGTQVNVVQPVSSVCSPPPLFEFPIPLPLPEGLNYFK